MEASEAMTAPTREELEEAARRFFEALRTEVAGSIHYSEYEPSEGIARSIEHATKRIADLDHQLSLRTFDANVTSQSEAFLASADARSGTRVDG